MRVKHLSLMNFRGFASLELDLDRPVTVLVGVNGSGKTSVLRAVAAAIALLQEVQGLQTGHHGAPLDQHDLRVGASEGAVVCRVIAGTINSLITLKAFEVMPAWQGSVSDTAGPMPFAAFVSTERHLQFAGVTKDAGSRGDSFGVLPRRAGYGPFLFWFKEREDAENARRVARADLTLEDPQLRAVRAAVAALMPGFEKLRIDRDQEAPAMVVTKAGTELRLDQLSDGERNLIALAGDLARRLVIANPEHPSPRETEAVILIDEVEQHLHPALQRKVIPSLQRAFPKAQLIVTTHSPQVLSSVPASSVVVLDHFEALPVSAPTQGRDTNAILREVFGVSERPEEEVARIRAIADLIEEHHLDEARAALLTLAEKLSESDDDVQRLRTRLDFVEAGL